MKLHLPVSLRKCLLALMSAVVGVTTEFATAGVMHTDATFQTYTDFGQNCGRYTVGTSVNALLEQIRVDEGGIVIYYTDGTDPYIISSEQGMINFSATHDEGHSAMVSPTFLATVLHNGSLDSTFSGRVVGTEHDISYSAMDIRGSNVYRLHNNGYDYMVQRMSKIVTDATWNPTTSITDMSSLTGGLLYHSGAGGMGLYDPSVGADVGGLAGPYTFIIGAINRITSAETHSGTTNTSVHQNGYYDNGIGASVDVNPLPNAIRGGDSGSPIFIYNTLTGQYEYLAAQQSGGGWYGQARGDVEWTHKIMESYNERVDMSRDSEIFLNSVSMPADFKEDNMGNCGFIYSGYAMDADDNVLAEYNGIKSGEHTWKDLSGIKDTQNWYSYDSDTYLNASITDLFFTENLVFTASQANNTIILNDTVDLGVGYAEFNAAKEAEKTVYTIVSSEGNEHLFNHAGYVVNAGAEVHLQLNNPDNYMYEWRKNGAGDLYIDGTGDTNALLNVGGSGKIYLQQTGGYAAYNVYAGSGATVIISDLNQIKRDFTFGAGGATLDMNGNSMDWYLAQDADGRFTINALTEQAVITNTADKSVELTFRETGNQQFKGSFIDTETGALIVNYNGGGVWELNSIHTNLSHHEDSSFNVNDGRVILTGTLTVHGKGSVSGQNANRLVVENDWHFADATMNVSVKEDAIFELGSHARLTGDVKVEDGGIFIMREGVKDRYEYMEGGAELSDTYRYRDYYGLKGDVSLAEGASMQILFNEGVTSHMQYSGSISGQGSLFVDLGTMSAVMELSGNNSAHTGLKELVAGGLILTGAQALGDTSVHKWIVGAEAFIASDVFTDAATALSHIDTASSGTLALTNTYNGQLLDLSSHQGLTIGALTGHVVQYGSSQDVLQMLTDANGRGYWSLGGGGGELVVNALLQGNADLYLGCDSFSTGTVTLTNTNNAFSGDIIFRGEGVVLNAVDGALGNSKISLTYGNGLVVSFVEMLNNVKADADGMLFVDAIADTDISLLANDGLTLSVKQDTVLTGAISTNSVYRFSADDGAVLRVASDLKSDLDVIIDAQGMNGGTVMFENHTSHDASVTVQGHRDADGKGDITLKLGADFAAHGDVNVMAGGTIDIAGNDLMILGTLSGSGVVQDSQGGGALVIGSSVGDMELSASIMVDTLRKENAGNLTLNSAIGVSSLYVDNGTLTLGANASILEGTSIYLNDETILSVANNTIDGDVYLTDGTAQLLHQNTHTSTINGSIYVQSSGCLKLSGGKYVLKGSEIGGDDAVISMEGGTLTFSSKTAQQLNGTLLLKDTVLIESRGSAEDMVRSFDTLSIAGGTAKLEEESWSTIWNISSLNGEGTLLWNSTTTHDTTSRLILSGDGAFSGTIKLDRDHENHNRKYGAFIELQADTAAKNAVIELDGKSATAVASLAINTGNAQIKGLKGNAHSLVYAGASMSNVAKDGTALLPTTSRTSVLTIDTAAGTSYTYGGVLGTSADTESHGLSLVKTGAGAQSFTGKAYVNNVTALGGVLSMDDVSIRGNISVGFGASLFVGDYELADNHVFSVLTGESQAESSAIFGGSLTLSGGVLEFDASALNAALSHNLAALDITGQITLSEGITTQEIRITNSYELQANQDYIIAKGDWGNLLNGITCSDLGYYQAQFRVAEDGSLILSVGLKNNAIIWNGTDNCHSWTSDWFGSTQQPMSGSSTVVFDKYAFNSTVAVEGNVSVAEADFVSDGTYIITNSGNGYVATVGMLLQRGTGETILESGIKVTGETIIEDGRLVVKNQGQLAGSVSGDGTLCIDWGSTGSGSLQIGNLGTLHIASGSYGTKGSANINVQNIIIESGARYIQGDNVTQTADVISHGGVIELAGGGLNGSLELTNATEIYIRSGDVNLYSDLQDHGHVITQKWAGVGTGILHIKADSKTKLGQYIVSQGTLSFDGDKIHSGHGTITVENNATLLVGSQSALEAEHIILNGGGKLLLRNGSGSNSYVSSDILTYDGSIISGSLNGNNSSIKGTIAGQGTLYFKTLDKEGQNVYTVHAVISDVDAGSPLSIVVENSYVHFAGDNTYSGGTTINSGELTVDNEHALGSGKVMINGGKLTLGADILIANLNGAGGELALNEQELTINQANYSGIISGSGTLVTIEGTSALFNGQFNLGSLMVTHGNVTMRGNTVIDSLSLVNSGATLTLGGSVRLGESLMNYGSVILESDIVFDLDVDRVMHGDAVLITGTGDIISQLGMLTSDNFTLNGAVLSDEVEISILQTNHQLQVSIDGLGRDRVWSGTESDVWNSSSANWLTTDGVAAYYLAYDNVTFKADGLNQHIQVQGNQRVNKMVVTDGNYRFTGGDIFVKNNLEIAEGASVVFDNAVDVNGVLIMSGDVTLNTVENQNMQVAVTGGSLVKNGSAQLTWFSDSDSIRLNSLTVNAGSFRAEKALIADSVSLAEGASLVLAHSDGAADLGQLSGDNATLNMEGSGELLLGDSTLSALTLKGNGSVTISGSVGVNHLSLGKTEVSLVNGASVTTSRYTSGNTYNSQPTIFTIGDGATLTVTGNNKKDATDSDMLLAHWGSSASLLHLQGGELNVLNTYMLMGWDSGGTFKATSGVANLYGIQFSTHRSNADKFILGTATEGDAIVNIGEHGIQNIGENDVVELGCGTLRALADWSVTGNGSVTFVAVDNGTCLDTNGYNVTIDTGINGAGTLVKSGNGTLVFRGNATDFTGMIDVQAGALMLESVPGHVHLSSGGSLLFGDDMTLSAGMHLTGTGGKVLTNLVLNGGSLGADAVWLNASSAAIVVENGYNISFAEGVTEQLIKIDGLMDMSDGEYFLVNGVFAEGINGNNFSLGEYDDYVDASFSVTENGLWMTLAGISGGLQIWHGTADAHTWNVDIFGSANYLNADTVIFNDEASARDVVLESSVDAKKIVFANSHLYTIASSNINYGLSVDSLEVSGIGSVRISSALSVGEIKMSKGTLEFAGSAHPESLTSLHMSDGATLKIGANSIELNEVYMDEGTGIDDLGGLGSVHFRESVSLAGSVNVGTINTMANASFVAGTNLHTLNVVAGVTTVHGASSASTINLAGGTTLNLVDGYTLATGSTISVAGVTTLGGDIIMAGGTLTFDTALTPDADALISFGGSLSLAENASVNITVKDTLQQSQGGTYVLATGDFSAFETANFNMSGLSDSLWSFSLNEDKTQLTLTISAFGIWNGTADAFEWNGNIFGAASSALAQTAIAIFDDSAEKTDVFVTENVSVKSVRFDNNKNYSFVASESVSLTTDSLEKAGTGSVSFGMDMNIGSGVSFNGCSILFEGDTSIDGALSTSNNAEVYFGADAKMVSVSLDSGTLTFGGSDSTVTIDGKLYAKRGLLNIGSSPEDSVFLTVNTFEASDSNYAGDLTINLAEGSTLKITGNDVVGNYKTTAFLLSEWNAVTTLNVDGTILSQNASLLVGDSSADINISGTVAVRGIGNGKNDKNGGTINLDMQDGAKLILGASGISTGKQFVANLGASTIGISAAAVTIAEDLAITSASGTVFDTAIYKFAEDGNSIVQSADGGILTISGGLSGDGKLIKQGAGELKLTASAFDYDGELAVKAGTVTINNAHASDGANKNISKVAMSDGAILQTYDAQAPTVATSFDCIQLEIGATATVQDVNHSGYIAINNLCGGADSILKLIKNAQSDHTGIFVLGSEDGTSQDYRFAGTIQLLQEKVNDARLRDVTLQLNHASIAEKSVISLESTIGSAARLGFGVNVDSATIAGLSSSSSVGTRAIVYSGSMGHAQTWNITKPTVNNELIIDTADNTTYTYYGQLQNIDITKNGDGTQIFAGVSSSYSGAITVNSGVLQFEVSSVGMLNAANSVTVNQFGIANLQVDNSSVDISCAFSGSGTLVKEGLGTLQLTGNSANFNGSISVNEGILYIGSGASSLLTSVSNVVVNKDSSLDLTNLGASALLDNVSGTGVVVLNYAVSGNGTGFNFESFSGTVQVDGGRVLLSSSQKGNIAPDIELTSVNSQLVFDGTDTVWNGNVSLLSNTEIHVNNGKDGELSGTLSGKGLTKRGAGSLVVSGGVELTALTINDGDVVIIGYNNEVGSLKCSVNGDKTGKLRLEEQSQLTVAGDIVAAVPANTNIVELEKGASLTSTQDSVIFSNRQGNNDTSLKTTSAGEEYSIGSSTYVLSNGHLQYTKNEDAELKNKLTNSSVAFSPENADTAEALHTLKVTHDGNTLTGILAEGGNIIVQNQATHSLQELKVAAGLTVGAYTGSSISASDEALIKVSQMAQFGHGATLNADLVMQSGATLQMDGTVTMGSDLTLMAGLTLTGSQYDEVRNLIADGESKVVLFEGIDKLILGNTEYTTSITMDDNILAHTYFGNIGSDYLLVYDATVPGNGVLSIMAAVPEPSTATLSLLALAALAARRRRR